jgi:hypothetical protein
MTPRNDTEDAWSWRLQDLACIRENLACTRGELAGVTRKLEEEREESWDFRTKRLPKIILNINSVLVRPPHRMDGKGDVFPPQDM